MTLFDTHYQHWQGRHLGLWRRRAVIAGNSLSACLRLRWVRYFAMLSWTLCLAQAAYLFLLGQILVPDSAILVWLQSIRLGTAANQVATWLMENPNISVGATYNILFYFFARFLMILAFLAVALVIPYLISQDLGSRAIIIYSSKALNRFDYFLGKFAAVFGLLTLIWLGPVFVGWIVGNLLSTQWSFFWYSRQVVGHALLFTLVAATILSLLALGVSALSPRARVTSAIWFVLWIIGNSLVPLAENTKPWLKYCSFSYDLRQIGLSTFDVQGSFRALEDMAPAGSTTLAAGDFVNLSAIAKSLSQRSNSAAIFLNEHLDSEAREALAAYVQANDPNAREVSSRLRTALAANFNQIMADENILNHVTFPPRSFHLHPEIRQLRGFDPKGDALLRLNRMVLEEIYPAELKRMENSWLADRLQDMKFGRPGQQNPFIDSPNLGGAIAGLVLMMGAACGLLWWRLKPE